MGELAVAMKTVSFATALECFFSGSMMVHEHKLQRKLEYPKVVEKS